MDRELVDEVSEVSDLVERLQWAADRDDDFACMIELDGKEAKSLLARIERLERELAAEKALADELEKVAHGVSWDHPARTAYRKARGL